jgi:NitT/TauT family transport system substrate-binding protein
MTKGDDSLFDHDDTRESSRYMDRRTALKGGLAAMVAIAGSGLVGANAADALLRTRLRGLTELPRKKLIPMNVVNSTSAGNQTLEALIEVKGYYTKYGVTVNNQSVSSGTVVLASLDSGAADLTIFEGMSSVFPALQAGLPLRLIAGINRGGGGYIATNNPAIKTMADIRGHKVAGGPPNALLYQEYAAMFAKYGFTMSDVTYENVGSSIACFEALVAGVVEVSTATAGNLVGQKGIRVIGDTSKLIPKWFEQTAVASLSTIQNKREGLIGVLAAYANLFQYLATPESKEDYILAYVSAGNGDRAQATADWNVQYRDKTYQANLALPKSGVDYVQGQNVLTGSQRSVLPYNQIVDLALAEAAVKKTGYKG